MDRVDRSVDKMDMGAALEDGDRHCRVSQVRFTQLVSGILERSGSSALPGCRRNFRDATAFLDLVNLCR